MWLHPQNLLGMLSVLLAAAAAVTDVRTGLIPNRLTVLGGLGLLALRVTLAGLLRGPAQVLTALTVGMLGIAVCGLIPLAMYIVRGIGGGDVKLLAAIGAGLGPVAGLEAELYAFGFGALYALARAAYGGVLWQTLRGSTMLLTNPLVPRRQRRPIAPSALTPIRFAPPIFAGALYALALHWTAP